MYDWLVLIHILGVLGFVFAHGVSAAMALRLRHERNPDRIRVMLQVSSSSLGVFYVSTGLLLIGGVWAGFSGSWWDQGWIWIALGVFIANIGFMYSYTTPFYRRVRDVMQIEESGGSAVGPEEMEGILRSDRPIVTVWVGLLSLGFIAFLMVIKPF